MDKNIIDDSKESQCKTCTYWFRAVEIETMAFGYGYCKNQPPAIGEQASELHQRLFGDAGKLIGIFPLTSEFNWCGEYQENPLHAYNKPISDIELVGNPSLWAQNFESEEDQEIIQLQIGKLRDLGVITIGDWLALGKDQPRLIPNLGYRSLQVLNKICSIEIKSAKPE